VPDFRCFLQQNLSARPTLARSDWVRYNPIFLTLPTAGCSNPSARRAHYLHRYLRTSSQGRLQPSAIKPKLKVKLGFFTTSLQTSKLPQNHHLRCKDAVSSRSQERLGIRSQTCRTSSRVPWGLNSALPGLILKRMQKP